MDPLLTLIVLALIAATVAMLLGILVMSGGGATDSWLSTPLMWVRVGFQGLTILLLILATFLR
jgi:hypoxia induced protein